ncbi:MAG TPA: ATP-grasp domain-containing protein [Candidatus Saccharimonadales bacterium]|nr:ATP-grasp domain-containing protein [Candidatus Saccharimonadales bacterium]
MSEDNNRDVIISVRDVEPELVEAVKKLGKRLGRELHGVVLINKEFYHHPDRYKDKTGFFKEVVCDFNDPNELQAAIKPYADRLLAITCRLENAIQQFRKVLPFVPYIDTPTESALLWCTEKQLMRDRLKTYDRSLVPEYHYLSKEDLSDFEQAADGLRYPVIVKPNGLKASLLVSKCDNKKELMNCLYKTFEVIDEVYEKERGTGLPGVLVEEMIQGDMYSTDAYVDARGNIYCLPLVRVTTAHEVGKPGFYGYRIMTPVSLSQQETQKAFEAASKAIKALNLNSSTAHIEMFHTKDGWKIIELGPRIGGYRASIYRHAYDIDHFYNDLAIRIGLKPEISTEPKAYATGLNIYADEEGIIESIKGLEEARKLPSAVYVAAHAKPGDPAIFAGNGGMLIVDAILTHNDKDQLEADVRRLNELVKINVRAQQPVRETADVLA